MVQEKEAYRSKFGWKAANEYEEDESVSDSADEKDIFRSERRVERQVGASQKKQIIAWTETRHVDMHTTIFFMKIQDISYCKAGRS